MSANLDLVRSILAAWERGEFRFSAEWHPEIEFVVVPGVVRGRDRDRLLVRRRAQIPPVDLLAVVVAANLFG